jgi:cell division protein FtsB
LRSQGRLQLANAKVISLIDSELRKQSAQHFSDLTIAISTIDDEFEKLRNTIKRLEERVDLLEHQ